MHFAARSQETSPHLFLVQLQTLLVTFCKDCTAVLFFNVEEFPLDLDWGVDSINPCVIETISTVACKLFRPAEVDSCHQVMKPCNFTTILPHSSSANNTDYKLPWKQVEFFVSELDFKLMATKNLSSFGGCNDWENLAVSQPLGGGASTRLHWPLH